jgi:hypothetical protein
MSAVGGIFQNSANQQNVQQDEAFQERMSDTSYQRGMADMKAAGLNPILAMDRGGASTPSGAVASTTNVGADASAGFAAGAHSAGDIVSKSPEIDNTVADTDLKKAQMAATVAQAKQTTLNSAITAAQAAVAPDMYRGQALSAVAKGDSDTYDVKSHQADSQYLSSPAGAALRGAALAGSDISNATSAFKNVPLGSLISKTFKSLGY